MPFGAGMPIPPMIQADEFSAVDEAVDFSVEDLDEGTHETHETSDILTMIASGNLGCDPIAQPDSPKTLST